MLDMGLFLQRYFLNLLDGAAPWAAAERAAIYRAVAIPLIIFVGWGISWMATRLQMLVIMALGVKGG